MNKKNIKKLLILIGIIPFIYTIISVIINKRYTIGHLPLLSFFIGIEEGTIEGIIQIIGIILIITGILINNNSKENVNIKKYKKLKKLGYILTIISAIYISLIIILNIIYINPSSTSLLQLTTGEIFNILLTLFFISFLWPIPIIGLILIIKSNQKLKIKSNKNIINEK